MRLVRGGDEALWWRGRVCYWHRRAAQRPERRDATGHESDTRLLRGRGRVAHLDIGSSESQLGCEVLAEVSEETDVLYITCAQRRIMREEGTKAGKGHTIYRGDDAGERGYDRRVLSPRTVSFHALRFA